MATISACAGESLTVAATADPAGARSLRGTRLMLRFQAFPLFREGRSAEWVDLGKAKKLNRTQSFGELPADLWVGAVRWRFVRGAKTVASGVARTKSGRAGGKRGRAACLLPIGLRPRDVLPPFVALTPNDSSWRRAPVEAQIAAVDDLSGVAEVYSRVDGGAITSGRTVTLAGEGAHVVEYGARDVAGNRSPTGVATVRVDAAAPSTPVIDFPPSVTGDSTPQVRWSAASDSGSGVRRYFVAVNASDGRLVATRDVPATGDATQSVTLSELAAGTYEVQVFAFDGVEPDPFVTASAKRGFEVTNQPPTVASTDPAHGAVRPASQRGNPIVLTFDRAMNPGTVNDSNITLTRTGGSASAYTVACTSPCLSALVTPQDQLDGEYTVAWSAGVLSEEGAALQASSATFHVNAFQTTFDGGCGGWSTNPAPNPWSCPGNSARAVENAVRGTLLGGTRISETIGPAVPYVPDNNAMYLTFDAAFTQGASDSYQGGLSFDGGACTYGSAQSSSGTKTVTISAPVNRSTVAVCFRLSIVGSGSSETPAGTSLTVDNVVLDRSP
jgi:hypothetical protein